MISTKRLLQGTLLRLLFNNYLGWTKKVVWKVQNFKFLEKNQPTSDIFSQQTVVAVVT